MKDKNTGIPINQEKIQQYLKDIRRIKVMTPQREKELAKIMKSGTLTDAQRDKVHKELLEGNLRFVITVAKQYQNQGLDFPDLIAEGNFGLMKAIKNFDWHKDFHNSIFESRYYSSKYLEFTMVVKDSAGLKATYKCIFKNS
jgi:DNA-directed RNA polymerase sigma subunit (sigma70/sigma32)